MKRYHMIIQGRVQLVLFRISTQDKAKKLGLTGWCRNKQDGTVEILVEGDEKNMTSFRDWCKKGPFLAKVNSIQEKEEIYQGEFNTFSIMY